MDQRQQVQARNLALERVHHVWVATIILGAFGALMFLWLGFDTGEWSEVLAYLASIAGSVGLAWLVWQKHSQIAAGLLLINAIGTPIGRFIGTGRVSNLLVAGILAFICFRGFQATMTLADMQQDPPTSAV